MRARVLGSAAGGGFPQWNCGCGNCDRARRGTAKPRTQASLAVSSDGERWILLGVSPDVRVQIGRAPELWPRARRESPIVAVALPNGDLDAWVGLYSLRENTPLVIHASEVVRRDLVEENGALRTLERYPGHSRWEPLRPGVRVPIAGTLTLEAVPAPGKPPLHMMLRRPRDPLDNVGFVVRDEAAGRSLAWFPSVAAPSLQVEAALRECDALFFDGTFYRADELARTGTGSAFARDMGHWPVGGEGGSAHFLARLPAARKWLVHVNNTNPLILDDSRERSELRALGIEVAEDGLTC
jgi:pyrroloquinoline quinone biosynthesis protein B